MMNVPDHDHECCWARDWPRLLKDHRRLLAVALTIWTGIAAAQGFRPPAFMGGVPGAMQFQAIQMQRHQARTLLYREALKELRKNPAAADVPECPATGASTGTLCLARAESPLPAREPEKAAEVPAPARTPEADDVETVRRRLAVLIGNGDYKSPIPDLETPFADVEKTAGILRDRYGFETRVLKNAGKAQIVKALNQIAAEVTPDDSVLLFYAGHGYLVDDTKMGFWIPVDASVKTATGWISNTDISKLLSAIRARQLILVSDSCFSGSLTKEQKVTLSAAPKGRKGVMRQRSVLVLSSGGEEPVSDEGKEGHSIFAWSLIKTLEATNGVTPGYEIYRQVHDRVTKEYSQEPQYGAAMSAGHVAGGEYLFDTGAIGR